MPKYAELDWYTTPLWYDLVFDEDTKKEADFLEIAFQRFGRVHRSRGGADANRPRVLEPACGSGRLVEEMARRRWHVTGFDASEEMLAFARKRLARRRPRLRADLRVARMESFRFREKFDLAHCFVSTFKYLLDEASARDHLRCVARALKRGGIYVLGFHLTDYDWLHCQHERWVGERAGVRVVCNIRSWPPSITKRRERVRSRLRIERNGRIDRTQTEWWFRTYDAAQVKRLLRRVPELEHVATYDFCYDWTRPRDLDDAQLDLVLILRRK